MSSNEEQIEEEQIKTKKSGGTLLLAIISIIIAILCTSLITYKIFGKQCIKIDGFQRDFMKYPIPSVVIDHDSNELAHMHEDRSVADQLYRKVRVLCWVMTQPKNHDSKAKHVKATWGKRCNKLLFMSSIKDESLPSVKLPVSEGRKHLWAKTKAAFKYVYKHHKQDADWFMKADDDTYVVVENLRYLLADYNSSKMLFFGCRMKPYSTQGYMSGGAGYVLSRAAMDELVLKALPRLCLSKIGDEDIEMGKCLNVIGVKSIDTRDSHKRGRFFPLPPENHIFPKTDPDFWFNRLRYYPQKEGIDCCSDYTVTFHYVKPHIMYVLEYLIYHVRPFGIEFGYEKLPKILESNDFTTEEIEATVKLLNTTSKIANATVASNNTSEKTI